mmetsp:Transcript_2446/g.4882  ORF Transcript_2446/g.4882 Transcript_2446/m.4882 type:complete len:123 (+) Transcript_2446:683-1051(+)
MFIFCSDSFVVSKDIYNLLNSSELCNTQRTNDKNEKKTTNRRDETSMQKASMRNEFFRDLVTSKYQTASQDQRRLVGAWKVCFQLGHRMASGRACHALGGHTGMTNSFEAFREERFNSFEPE